MRSKKYSYLLNPISNLFPKNKVELIFLLIIILLASFLRLYKIADYMTFLGDEGRDVLVAYEILQGDLTLLGPRASAGDFFLGPIYYYMIAPFLWLFNNDPVGPAVFVALVGIATVFLVYHVGKRLFDIKTGLFAAALYAVSPVVIRFSRSSWNPNPMPFVSLLSLYLLYLAVKKNSWKLFGIVGFLLGIAMQLHYLSTFLAVIIGLFTLFGIIIQKRKKFFLQLIKSYLQIALGFFLGVSPFLLFEIRHSFPNTKTIFSFIFQENLTDTYNAYGSFMGAVEDVFFRLYARLLFRFPPPEQVSISESPFLTFLQILTVVVVFLSVLALVKKKNILTVGMFLIWLLVGVVLFGFYKREIYDYYFGFIFPVPFILVGYLLSQIGVLVKYKKTGFFISIVLFSVLFIYNLQGQPFQFSANKQKDQAEKISQFILDKAGGKPFNFALITGGNSDHAYRYFFVVNDNKPVTIENYEIDPERRTVTDQLFIVCEGGPCAPLGDSLWEIAGFGRAEIAGEWKVSVVTVYKLVPYEDI